MRANFNVHQSAIGFRAFSVKILGETVVPGPEEQVFAQEPINGLYFRFSGRLLTSQPKGNLVDRVRRGHKVGALFELQRAGNVSRQAPDIRTDRRTSPVFCLDDPSNPSFAAIRWIDKEGFHQAIPDDYEGRPMNLSVQTWLGDRVTSAAFAENPSGSWNRKITSDESADPALMLLYSAQCAYKTISHMSLTVS